MEVGEVETQVSRRRQKRVARLHRFGFVVDLKPDLEVAQVSNGGYHFFKFLQMSCVPNILVFCTSQDVAMDLELLKKHKITHIINCATGIRNLYPKNFVSY